MTTLGIIVSRLEAHANRCQRMAEAVACSVGGDGSVAGIAAMLHETPALPPFDVRTPTEWLRRAAVHASSVDQRPEVAEAVRLHRELADGSGPFGHTRRHIPLAASIVGLVHAYDLIVDGDSLRSLAALEFLRFRGVYPQRLVAALVASELAT